MMETHETWRRTWTWRRNPDSSQDNKEYIWYNTYTSHVLDDVFYVLDPSYIYIQPYRPCLFNFFYFSLIITHSNLIFYFSMIFKIEWIPIFWLIFMRSGCFNWYSVQRWIVRILMNEYYVQILIYVILYSVRMYTVHCTVKDCII